MTRQDWKVRAMPRRDAPPGGDAGDIGAEQFDAAFVCGTVPADHVEQRGLPRPVGTDEPDHRTVRDADRGAVEGLDAAEADPDAVGPDGVEVVRTRR